MSSQGKPVKIEVQVDPLCQYVMTYSIRGSCRCGKCIDAGPDKQPEGHTVSVEFFDVAVRGNPDAETLKKLIGAFKSEEVPGLDLFDRKEHSYIEIGGWLGSQGLALELMGLGSLLGLWRLLTPTVVFGKLITRDQALRFAGMGMVGIVVSPAPAKEDVS